METVGQRIAAARAAKRLTQAALGDLVGAHEKTVSRWENDKQLPDPPQFAALSRELGETEAWLRYGNGQVVRESTEQYTPRAAATRRLPPRAREVVYSYLSRLEELGLPDEEIDEVERVMVEATFNKLHVHDPRERSDQELITDIHAAWEFVKHILAKRGLRP